MPVSFARFRRHMIKSAETNGQQIPHGGDWKPVLVLDLPGDVVDVVPLADFAHTKERWIDAMTDSIPKLIVHRQARLYGLLHMTWQVSSTLDAESVAAATAVAPSEHPDRQESLQLQVGSPIEHGVWLAPVIRRSTGGPRLGPWRRMTGSTGTTIEPLRQAIMVAGRAN